MNPISTNYNQHEYNSVEILEKRDAVIDATIELAKEGHFDRVIEIFNEALNSEAKESTLATLSLRLGTEGHIDAAIEIQNNLSFGFL